jgi:hypothetical protein
MSTFRLVSIIAGLIALLLGLSSLVRYLPLGPEEDALLEPRIHNVPDRKMLVLAARGNPAEVAGPAFAALYKAYFKSVKGAWRRRPEAPRARWAEGELQREKPEWQGRFALPVPDDAEIPAQGEVHLTVWEYGLVAEVLHAGAYSDEAATVERLRAYVRREGYRVIGDHEEIYLRGPGLFLRGNPARYRTLIRYRVAPAGPEILPPALLP